MKQPLEVLRLYPEHDYTLVGAFESRMRADPRRAFLVHQERTWSWGEFHAAALRVAQMLAARGVTKGDRVGIIARNSDAHVLTLFACARIGAIMVPSNPEFGVQEAGYVEGGPDAEGKSRRSRLKQARAAVRGGIVPRPGFRVGRP